MMEKKRLYHLVPAKAHMEHLYNIYANWLNAYREKFIDLNGFKSFYKNAKAIIYENQVIGMLNCDFAKYGYFEGCFGLDTIFLDSEFRGKGIGSIIIKDLITSCDLNNYSTYLFVNENNHQAIKLYKKLGFTYVIQEKDFLYFGRKPKMINKKVSNYYKNSPAMQYIKELQNIFNKEKSHNKERT